MGVVYLAQDPQIERLLALKTIRFDGPSQSIGKDEAKARFLKEAKLSGRLQHPNIVTVYDVGEDAGTLYLAMELVSGGSFQQKLAAPDLLSLTDRIRIVAEVADALAHAHERGVIHRDVKPANILLTETLSAKVTDFGIGKLVTGDTDLTTTGQMVGSPAYMSPEQIRGEKLDVRSDIFSLGVVLFQALTFKKPFPADTLTSLVYQILHEEPPDPCAVISDLPPEMGEIVRGCLAKKREARYSDAAVLAEDLRTVIGISPTSSTSGLSESKVRRAGLTTSAGATVAISEGTSSVAASRTMPAPPVESSGSQAGPSVASGSVPPPLPAQSGVMPGPGRGKAIGLGALAVVLVVGAVFAVRQLGKKEGPAAGGLQPVPTSGTSAGPASSGTPGPVASPFPYPAAVSTPLAVEKVVVVERATPPPKPTRTPRSTPTPRSTIAPTPAPAKSPAVTFVPTAQRQANLTVTTRRAIKLNVSPDQARVFLDGKFIGISDDWDDAGGGSYLIFGKDGFHRFRFAYPGFRDFIVDVNVAFGSREDKVEIERKLEPGTPEGPTGPPGKLKRPDYKTQGAVRFTVEPAETNVTINGIALGPASQWKDKDLDLQAPGVHEVALSAPGHEPKVLRVVAASATGKQVATIKERLKKR